MHAAPAVLRHWILAEFASTDALIAATRTMREKGHAHLDTYTPYPVHGLSDALGLAPSRVPWIAAGGAIVGGSSALGMQYWMNAVDYPLNVGNRMIASVPTWIPVTFELTVLLTGFSIFFGLWTLMRLPRLHHPVFEHEAFRTASTHGFWLSVEQPVVGHQNDEIVEQLKTLGATNVAVVPEEELR